MINNRQAGRRRGRNNPRQGGGGNRGGGDSGNRIDNRARGNAAQLLEKYRNMARDAQMAGDRVNCEYYLQFADHYFRVLADNRARQEEQQVRHRRFDEIDVDDEFGDESDGLDAVERDRAPESRAFNGHARGGIRRREQRDEVAQIAPSDDGAEAARPESREMVRDEAADERPARTRRPRKTLPKSEENDGGEAAFDAAVLPPSIGRSANDSGDAVNEDGAAPTPRRTRRPRATAQAAE